MIDTIDGNMKPSSCTDLEKKQSFGLSMRVRSELLSSPKNTERRDDFEIGNIVQFKKVKLLILTKKTENDLLLMYFVEDGRSDDRLVLCWDVM